MQFRDDMTVQLIQSMGDDSMIVAAAKVSTQGADSLESIDHEANAGLINFLMSNRHGTPFEHGAMTFYVEAPIFVFREWHRHRIGWSYNEMSGRYKELSPTFYEPHDDRPLVQVGKPGHYTYVAGEDEQVVEARTVLERSYDASYGSYERLLKNGVAKEVARLCLPVGVYSSMYATCNPRSLMAFLSLRTKEEGSKFPSYPQHEIELCARQMEAIFAELYPITYASFVKNGRVAP